MVNTSRLIGWLVTLILILGGAYALYYYFNPLARQPFPDLASIGQFKRSGNDQEALAQYKQIQANSSKTAEEKANAVVYVAGVSYSVSGDPADLIKEVQDMKRIVNDTTLSPEVRAVAMSVLGNEYAFSGRNQAVFAEIYNDPPFNSYLVPNNQELSALNLEKASYGIKPTSFAAIKIADIATAQYFLNPHQSASTTANYVALAEDYLRRADAVTIEEAKSGPAYRTSDRYILYQLARLSVVGRLAVEKGAPYTSMYANEFERFIAAAQTGNSTLAKNSLIAARYQYARILAALKDTDNEKKQLDLLATDLNSLQNPEKNPLIITLKNARLNNPSGSAWTATQQMMGISSGFDSLINKLTAPSK